MSVCLDAFALLAWLKDEPGADLVEGFLNQADSETDFDCFVSLINLGEVYYRLGRYSDIDVGWNVILRRSRVHFGTS